MLLVAALATAPALAAPSRAGDDRDFGDSSLTSVPAISGRGWILQGSVRARYDTNIRRLGTLQPLPAGQQRADFLTTPTIEAAVALPVGRQQLFAGAEFGRDIYARNTQLSRNRYRFGGGVNLRAGSRCTGSVGAEYSSKQVQLSEIAGLRGGVQNILTYGGEANCQAGVGLGFGGSIRRVAQRNSELARQLLDLDSTVFSPQISYALPVFGRFSIGGSYNKAVYKRRPVILTDGSSALDGVDIASGRIGFSREVGSRLSVSLGASYLNASPKPQTVLVSPGPALPLVPIVRGTFSGIGYDGAITYRAGARLTATLQARRDVQANANVGAQFRVTKNYGIDLDYRLSRAISVGTGATFDSNRYRGAFVTPDEPLLRISDRITRVYGTISYAPVKLYNVALDVAYQNRVSVPAFYSFKSTSVMLRLGVRLGRQ
jgi:hypothetical protein